ncbi:uncharacterized protein JCM15063_003225 [Sporobolomyces koalae]|uniref:uncharacterized protein n=1 Tax=Sporobolomyces koalae TaxID=500713 RepID=UPI00316F0075
MNEEIPSLPRLSNSADYASWAFTMKHLLKGKGLWGFVDGTNKRPSTSIAANVDQDAINEWDQLDSQAITVEYKNGDNLNEHISSMFNIALELAAINEKIPDHYLVVFLLASLAQSWESVVATVEAVAGGTSPASAAVVSQNLKEGDRRKTASETSLSTTKSTAAALVARPPEGGRKDKRNVECHICNRKGSLCPRLSQ